MVANGSFLMFLGTIRALRLTMGRQRSLFGSAFNAEDNFVRMSSRSPQSFKACMIGFMDILVYEMGDVIQPSHCVMEIYLLIW